MRSAIRILVGIVVVGTVLVTGPSPSAQVSEGQAVSVELVPLEDTRFMLNDRTYEGTIRVMAERDGLVLTELVTLDQYLAGIREVPFTWPEATLAAQVVAARTYLAYTLLGGRRGNAAAYGYDICATSACQVYAGTGLSRLSGGDRWVSAVERTAGEILLATGRPAQTVYSASAGPRTRSNQDIWGGEALSYLQAVDSPEEGVSPYDQWRVEVTAELFVAILSEDGHEVSGDLDSILVRDPGEGSGRVTLWVDTDGGAVSLPATHLKGAFNRHGPDLAPGVLPARSENGGTLPQALPSYTFDIVFDEGVDVPLPEALVARLPRSDLPPRGRVIVEGSGWGHGVGLSQWGALALGRTGATYEEILAHYYGGLVPTDGGDYVPDDLVVGLGWSLFGVEVEATGLFELRINGVSVATLRPGLWTLRRSFDTVAIVAPLELEDAFMQAVDDRLWPR